MSRTTLYKVNREGDCVSYQEFRNAFRGAFLVWDNMAKAYLSLPGFPVFLEGGGQKVWDLWRREDVPLADRIVMAATFDKVMVRKENIPTLVKAIHSYGQRFDAGTLPEQAEALIRLKDDEDCIAVCWQQTSVSEDVWFVWNYEEDEGRPYNINTDQDHWFLFDELPTDGLF